MMTEEVVLKQLQEARSILGRHVKKLEERAKAKRATTESESEAEPVGSEFDAQVMVSEVNFTAALLSALAANVGEV